MPGDSATPRKVVVAMSGGVDSSVAALLIAAQGYDAIGVSMQVWDYRNHGGCSSRATCCAPDDFTDARKVAAAIGIPYYVFDFEHTFREQVIEPFIAHYRQGLTPNPCVECNNKVKFRELRTRAKTLECDAVATGHYARIIQHKGELALFRARDRAKDQSYFLYGLTADELSETLFPLGELTKAQVRERAREAGLTTAEKPESQDICFVSGKVQDFIAKMPGSSHGTGPVKTTTGEVLSMHHGIENFTVGQRRGLSLGGMSEPSYVVALDPVENAVIVGSKRDLEVEGFEIDECSSLSPELDGFLATDSTTRRPFRCIAQVRSRHGGVEVELSRAATGALRATFTHNSATISPGQAAVFYDLDDERVLGGGKIARATGGHPAKSPSRLAVLP